VARDPANSAVVEHRARGGEAVFIDARAGMRWIVLATGADARALMPVDEIPATLGGLLRFNETNAMFATALAWAQGVDTGVIRRALSTFTNSAEQNPGRYNVIEGLPFRVLLDYAHNPDGVGEICALASALPVSGRRVICSLTVGNRHPSHVVAVAPVLAETFDEIVLGCDPHRISGCADYAGDDPTATMLSTTRQLLLDAGAAAERITTEADPATAIRRAMGLAAPGDLVVVLAEPGEALPVIVGFITG
jgi:cyanophycin synthetase